MMTQIRRTKGLDLLFESLVVIFLISIGTSIILGYYALLANRTREVLLIAELRNIRTAISLFKGFERRYPESLKELGVRDIPITAGSDGSINKYLTYQKLNEEGHPVDPFGNIYRYNSDNGRVNSSTPKYSNW